MRCATCEGGWIGVGFTDTPGAMVGATAVLGWTEGDVGLYSLEAMNAGNPSAAITALPPAEASALQDATIESADGGGVTMAFTIKSDVLVGELAVKTLLYATGEDAAAPSYHGDSRGAKMTNLLVAAPSLPPGATEPDAAVDAPARAVAPGELEATTTAAGLTVEFFGAAVRPLELAGGSFGAGALFVALLCGVGILVCRCRALAAGDHESARGEGRRPYSRGKSDFDDGVGAVGRRRPARA